MLCSFIMGYTSFPQRKKNRLRDYNYSQNGWYFVTICTYKKQDFFGKIENGNIVLNEYGNMVKQQWEWLENQYHYIYLDEWIIMPNHVHGIIVIENEHDPCRDRSRPVPTIGANTSIKIKSLSEIMGAFKTTSSKMIHIHGLTYFKWQRSFHDHIIRTEKKLQNIRKYIQNNPIKFQ